MSRGRERVEGRRGKRRGYRRMRRTERRCSRYQVRDLLVKERGVLVRE